jgi:hypothetical protein
LVGFSAKLCSLLQQYQGQAFLRHVFQHLLRQTARTTALLPAGQFGSGIIDAHALLTATPPDPGAVVGPGAVAELTVLTPPEVIAALYGDADPNAVRAQLATVLTGDAEIAAAGMEQVDDRANVWGPELIHILTQDQAAYRQFGAGLVAAAAASPQAAAASTQGQPTEDVGRLASNGLRAAPGS